MKTVKSIAFERNQREVMIITDILEIELFIMIIIN